MLQYKIVISLLIISLFPLTSVNAQDVGNSPYSRFGIGDIANQGFTQSQGMGGTGIAHGERLQINNINSALLFRNRNTIFEGGAVAQIKTMTNGEGTTKQDFGGNFNYLSICFPVNRYWTAQVGITPYSTVNYNNSYSAKIANSDFTAQYAYTGSGGLNNIFFASGFKIIDPLYVGVKINYIFGSIVDESSATLNTNLPTNVTVIDYFSTRFRSLVFQPGIFYRLKIKDELYLNVGATYSVPTNVSVSVFNAVQQRSSSGILVTADTVTNDAKSSLTLPQKVGFGISLGKEFKWAVTLDANFQSWSSWKNSDTLANSTSIASGFEFTPDINALKGFLKRVTYRVGVNYTQTPYLVRGVQLTDISASFGLSMPFNRAATSLNMAFIVGRRGTTQNNLLVEDYLKMYLGVTINDRWFIKRKVD